MADVYVVTRVSTWPQRFEMTDQERDEMFAKVEAAIKDAGGERTMALGAYAGDGAIVIDRFPSLAACDKARRAQFELGVRKYWITESKIYFDIKDQQ